MSLWWARREQLDKFQVRMIEQLPLQGNYLILGPPGSGKTNVLLRRAQFVRLQGMPNVMVLSFTRALTEFVKTGCYDAQGREIFPSTLVNTLEGWIRSLYAIHDTPLPPNPGGLGPRKAAMAAGALQFARGGRVPPYETLFVDEAQDLMREEVELLRAFSPNLFFVGDDRQRIYDHTTGLDSVRSLNPAPEEKALPFHYRLVDDICEMADRIQVAQGGEPLLKTSHYDGPKPGRIEAHGPLTRAVQTSQAIERIKDQIRVYADMLQQGDRIGIIVPRRDDREFVLNKLEADPTLAGKAQIIRARTGDAEDRDYDPSFDDGCPISILTSQGCKGLEFRAVHWLFCNDLAGVTSLELYYTVVTRAKTRLDMYHSGGLPQTLAGAYKPPETEMW